MTSTRPAVKPSLPLSARDIARRAQHVERASELPEVVSAVLPQHLSFLRAQHKQAEEVSAHDFFKQQDLHQKMRSLALSDHFDSFGKSRFQRLGLAFAAKQFLPKNPTTPHSSLSEAPAETKKPSAKAFILSQEALAKDFQRWSQYTREIADSIQETDRQKDEDVKRRQVNILFAELPYFLEFLPDAVPVESLEFEINRDKPFKPGFPRRWPAQSRKFRKMESQALIEVFRAWSLASWPLGGAELGMDRATFTRFVLDVGLVDQRKVTLFWALSLFDCLSHSMRVCAKNELVPQAAPLLPVVKWWDLLSILEVLTAQHFRTTTAALRVKFIENIAEISRFRLPTHALKAVDISQPHLEFVLQGVKSESHESDDEHGNASQDVKEMQPGVAESRSSVNEPREVGGASKEQMAIVEESRVQRQRGMLVEPEVLHLLWQHETIFKGLHAAYSDHEGHMTFAALTQLCKDFSLAPHLISLHQLRKIYESAECLDPAARGGAARIDTLSQDLGIKKGRGGSPSRSQQASARRRSISATTSPTNSDGVRASMRPSDAMRSKRSTIVTLGKINARQPLLSDSSSSQTRRRSLAEAGSMSGQSMNERLGLLLPWEALALKAREATRQTTASSVGFPALMEILCKVAYTYLGCYGNMQQRSMSPLIQTVWLLVYLRFSAESYNRSLEKRRLDRAVEEKDYGALSRAAALLKSDVWLVGDAPTFEDGLPPPVFRDLASNSSEDGSPCIVDETCQLCKRQVRPQDWGNVRCFACSKIDVLAFKHHPLHLLIRRAWDSKSVVIAGKVPRVRNISLSPPPFKDSNALQAEKGDEVSDSSFQPSSSSFSDL